MKFVIVNGQSQQAPSPKLSVDKVSSSQRQEAPSIGFKDIIGSMEEVPSSSLGLGGNIPEPASSEMAKSIASSVPKAVVHGLAQTPGAVTGIMDLAILGGSKIFGGAKNYDEYLEAETIPGIKNKYWHLPKPQTILKAIEGATDLDFGSSEKGMGFWDDVGSTATSLIAFGGGAASIPAAFLGKTAKSIAKSFKAPEWAQEVSDIAGQLGANLLSYRVNVGKLKNSLYDSARLSLPEGTAVAAEELDSKIDKFLSKMKKDPSKDARALEEQALRLKNNNIYSYDKAGKKLVDEIGLPSPVKGAGKGLVSRKADVSDLISFKQGLNKRISDIPLGKSGRKYLGELVDITNEAIAQTAKSHPEFYNAFKAADQIHGALASSEIISNFISEHPKLSKVMGNPILNTLFGVAPTLVSGAVGGLPGAAMGAIGTAGVVGGGALAMQAAKAAKSILTNKHTVDLFKKTTAAAMAGEAANFMNNYNKLSKEMAKGKKFVVIDNPEGNP